VFFYEKIKLKMNLRQIQELIKFVAKSGATEVDIEIGDVKLSIKSPPKGKFPVSNNELPQMSQQVIPIPQQQIVQPVIPQQNNPVPSAPVNTNIVKEHKTEVSKNEESIESTVDDSKYVTIKAPIIGTFYRRSSPDKDPFVNVGDKIEEGQALCIIEAMKLFNEIESEFSGTIIKVLVDDMSPVEYDQPLFLVDPS
tara:strand:- start:488 stop:1075 length:588 start_codon:yes stop_codon:yes gene_type:complete